MRNDQVARTVRAALSGGSRPADDWAKIKLDLLALHDAVREGDPDRIEQTRRALAYRSGARRVDPFGEHLDLPEPGGVPPEPGLHELVNTLLTDLGFPTDLPPPGPDLPPPPGPAQ
ncbi:hypothetical protein BJ973_001781 [Actinoplanes tereljensis]|uniref:CATRA-Associated Small Protein domain-containing protein n=1 Tax=Paractinoplanes tereljensis TaxID=571912 RepID=A0A919TRI4_9ACTN|nr:CATRA system-associated protein [Actinoplanes tereljensis]GIF20313.1 hypothetical protein Ate02nite_30430 [Actinoplanes tereljensis]